MKFVITKPQKKDEPFDIEFGFKNKVSMCLFESEIDMVSSCIPPKTNLSVFRGIIGAYLIIRLHQLAHRTLTEYVNVPRDSFLNNLKSHNYYRYTLVLLENNLISKDTSNIKRTQYKTHDGKLAYKTEGLTRMKSNIVVPRYEQSDIMFSHAKLSRVEMTLDAQTYNWLKLAYESGADGITDTRFIPVIECIKNLTKEIIEGKITSDNSLSKAISRYEKKIFNHSREDFHSEVQSYLHKVFSSLDFSGENLNSLDSNPYLKLILNRINNSKDHTYTHNNICNLSVTSFPELILPQSVTLNYPCVSYHSELKFKLDVLDHIFTRYDLNILLKLNDITGYKPDGKLYSFFSYVKREARKHITFRGANLVEVSDIHSAHYTMLPAMFAIANANLPDELKISIPEEEMACYKKLTQESDIYGAIASTVGVSRNEIKPFLQPFMYSINDNQFIHAKSSFNIMEKTFREAIVNFFTSSFPHIHEARQFINKHFSNKLKDENGECFCFLKKCADIVESAIMNQICSELISLGLHPFRLHDAIYMSSNESSEIPFDISSKATTMVNLIA